MHLADKKPLSGSFRIGSAQELLEDKLHIPRRKACCLDSPQQGKDISPPAEMPTHVYPKK